MKKSIKIIKESIKRKMLGYKQLVSEQKDRQKLKDEMLNDIIAKIDEIESIRWDRAGKLRSVLDEIVYKATDKGFSFNGRKKLANLSGAKVATVDKAIKLLKMTGEVFVGYGVNPDSNGYKTPVIFFKSHEYYPYWNKLLQLEEQQEVVDYAKSKVENEVENAETSTGTTTLEQNYDSTNLTLKSETFTKKIKDNKEENFNIFEILSGMNLSKDQRNAKELIQLCPSIQGEFRTNARKIAIQLPKEFSEIDYGVLGDLLRNLQKYKANKQHVSYFVKSFYKNKLYEAEKLNQTLDNEIPKELLPAKHREQQELAKFIKLLEAARKSNNEIMIQATTAQIEIIRRKMAKNNSKCHVQFVK